MDELKVKVGSQNKVKVNGVEDALSDNLYRKVWGLVSVEGVSVDVPEFGHPVGIVNVVEGAKARALAAFEDCDISVGLESGMIECPGAMTGYLETTIGCIYDGEEYFVGMSAGFEWPKDVAKYILAGKGDASKAFKDLGLFGDEGKLGAQEGGVIGFLSEGLMPRETHIKDCVQTAMIYFKRKVIAARV